jgi:hypothetical protein
VITSARWSETQLTSRQRRLDRALEVVADGQRRLEHTEWQLEMEADTTFRMYEYHALTAFALDAETPAGQERPRIQSTLVLLSGRDRAWEAYGSYQTSPDGEPFSGVSFRIEAVYQRTVAELVARGPLWAIFAPLAVALTVVATKDTRQRGLRGAILGMLTKEDVMQSSVYELGARAGEERGEQKTMVSLYERRLGRTMTDEERAVLVRRLEKLGTGRLLDLPFSLSADALAAWLADPTAA